MKQNTHPEYGATTIRCACGNVIETKSTVKGTVQVDVCSSCHPFFTGKQKIMDTAGRIDRFKKKFGDKVAHQKPQTKPSPNAAPVQKLQTEKEKKTATTAKLQQAKDKIATKK